MKQFNDMKKMMKQFTGGGKGKKAKRSQMENMLKGMNLPSNIYCGSNRYTSVGIFSFYKKERLT